MGCVFGWHCARTMGQTDELLPLGCVQPKLAQAADLHAGRPLHKNKSLFVSWREQTAQGKQRGTGKGQCHEDKPRAEVLGHLCGWCPWHFTSSSTECTAPSRQVPSNKTIVRASNLRRAQHGPWMMVCPLPRHLGGGTCMRTASLFFCFLTV